MTNRPFSERHSLAPEPPEPSTWNDAPEALRFIMLNSACKVSWVTPSTLRDIICGLLLQVPNPQNWSDYPNIYNEVENLVYNCEWYRVYDIMEEIAQLIDSRQNDEDTQGFQQKMNSSMRTLGIGWQLQNCELIPRGSDEYEIQLAEARSTLDGIETGVAHGELSEAIRDIARRPEPDLSGAIQHAMAALESVARYVTGQPNPTLGKILGAATSPVPKPLDDAIGKVWGFASEVARHGREGRELRREEAQLVVGLAAAVSMYLIQKTKNTYTPDEF